MGRSTLAVILFHFIGNAFGELFALTAGAEVFSTVLSAAFALAVMGMWRVGEGRRGTEQGCELATRSTG